jgi:glucose/arabinose dehydrogenase
MRDRRVASVFLCAAVAAGFVVAVIITTAAEKAAVLTGKAAMGDWTSDGPGGLLRGGGHWTRCIVFSADGKTMYVSIGSRSNVSDSAAEENRACIFELNPDGTGQKVYAWGIRNAVGIAFRPGTNELWMSTNERDEIGENLPPDYISSVRPGGFYGWPWYYIGNHQDPRHKGKHPELADKVIVPDVLGRRTRLRLICLFTPATNSRLNTKATSSLRFMVHGIA